MHKMIIHFAGKRLDTMHFEIHEIDTMLMRLNDWMMQPATQKVVVMTEDNIIVFSWER